MKTKTKDESKIRDNWKTQPRSGGKFVASTKAVVESAPLWPAKHKVKVKYGNKPSLWPQIVAGIVLALAVYLAARLGTGKLF